MEIKIIVAEPWNFSSSDGENILCARVIMESEDEKIVLVCSQFSNAPKYLLLKKRDVYGNYNIYGMNNITNIDIDKQEINMIGKIL